MLPVFFSCKNATIESFIQATKRTGANLTDQAPDAIIQKQVYDFAQLALANHACFIVIKNMEQEQINGGLLQLTQTSQPLVDVLTQSFVAIAKYMILLRIVQDFLEHGFVGIVALDKNVLEVALCFAFRGETIKLHII